MLRSRSVLLPLLLVLAAACYRTAAPSAAPGASQALPALRIENPTDRIMVVSYEDARGITVLGSVRAGRTQRFVLPDVPPGEVSIFARSNDGSVTLGPLQARLGAGTTTRVVLK